MARHIGDLPHALEDGDQLTVDLAVRRPAVFLDYVGTLTPIAVRPEDALISESYANTPAKIIIVGGGIGGLAAATELARTLGGSDDVGVALLVRVSYTACWPMLPSMIPRNVEVRHVAHSIRRILGPLEVEVFQDEVTGMDFQARRAKTDEEWRRHGGTGTGRVGREAHVRYVDADTPRSLNSTMREVNDLGVCVDSGEETSFFPWSSVVRIDLGHSRPARGLRPP